MDKWPLGPYIVLEPTQYALDFKKIPAGSEFEARQIADRLEEKHQIEIGIYRWVADDDAYVLMNPPPSEKAVVCEPIPINGPMTCRRSTGSCSTVQGQPIPKCDGILKPIESVEGMYSCGKCGLTHATVVVNGETKYGAVL